jgi:3-hydroxybutyryl-CoA dehydrogenase
MQISRVGVVGCGLMGSGIAEVMIRAGMDVIVHEVNRPTALKGQQLIEDSLNRGVLSGKLQRSAADTALNLLHVDTDFDALADRQFVVEAVTEREDQKLGVFARLDRTVVDGTAILATNTSSIPIMKLAMATERPQQVIGVHFFNPVPVQKLVELVPSLLSSELTITRTEDFVANVLMKDVVRSKDRAGFVVNSLLIPYLLSAIRMLESGFATAEDIDRGMVEGCAHPMGPLALADFIGLDTTLSIAESLYEEFKEHLYATPPLLARMVDAGLLGRKTGRGFWQYPR